MSTEAIPLSIPDYLATLTPEEREVKMASPAYKELMARCAAGDAQKAVADAAQRVATANAARERAKEAITSRQLKHQAEIQSMHGAAKPLQAESDEAAAALYAAQRVHEAACQAIEAARLAGSVPA